MPNQVELRIDRLKTEIEMLQNTLAEGPFIISAVTSVVILPNELRGFCVDYEIPVTPTTVEEFAEMTKDLDVSMSEFLEWWGLYDDNMNITVSKNDEEYPLVF